jgi:hypothetical protein
MTETTQPVGAAELLAYLLTQYERAVSIHAQVRMDTDEDRRLHADAVTALRRAAEPVARYLDRAAREPVTVADIPAGQGPASLYVAPFVGDLRAVYFKAEDGRVARVTEENRMRYEMRVLWEHLAATLPHVTTEEES